MSPTESPLKSNLQPTTATWIERGQQVLMNTYSRIPTVITEGQGVSYTDADGKTYLDFGSGIAVNALGTAHPAWLEALTTQAQTLVHTSNLFWTTPQIQLAEALTQWSGLDQVFFCNSGAEANEAALKLARKWGQTHKGPNAIQVLTMAQSFHGRTLGALSLTGQPKYQTGFGPLVPDIHTVPWGDVAALQSAITPETCAVFIEIIQGEGGVRPLPEETLLAIEALCQAHQMLLIVDEVQTGLMRTGKPFAFQHSGITPHIITLAKGLGGGFPIGAMVAQKSVANAFQPGDHASTFGGTPLACAVALSVVQTLQSTEFEGNVLHASNHLHQGLLALQAAFPETIQEVRGKGLMWGLECTGPVAPFMDQCRAQGLIVLTAGANILRLVPPLTVSTGDIDHALSVLHTVFASL